MADQISVSRRITVGEYAATLRSRGVGDRMVRDLIEMFAAQDGGIYDADWAAATIAATGFRTWCRQVLKPAAHATS